MGDVLAVIAVAARGAAREAPARVQERDAEAVATFDQFLAVVPDAPVVPVAWVCGNATVPDKMVAKGANRTNLELLFLPLRCRP